MEHGQRREAAVGTPRERLPRAERLTSRAAFRRVYERGEAHHGRNLVLFVLRSPELGCRVGFVSGRKVGPATRRNRARRLLREAYRRLRPHFNSEGEHAHFAIVARRPLCAEGLSAALTELQRLFEVAGVLNDDYARPK